MKSILSTLVNDIEEFVIAKTEKAISAEMTSYKKSRVATEEQILKYRKVLEKKHEKQAQDEKLKLAKAHWETEAKYGIDSNTRINAKRELQLKELQDKREKLEQEFEERRARVINKHEEQRNALLEARAKKEEAALEKQKNAMVQNQQTLSKIGSNIANQINKGVESYIGAFSKYFTQIEVGLLGTGGSFNTSKSLIDRVVGLNPAVKQTDVLEKLSGFIDKGILRDAELRATLATVGTKISNTFNSLDPTLLSLSRILREDTTIARLGMEAQLSRFMGGTFQDTSYFANDTNSYVSAQLLQAMSQVPEEIGAELEYAVQKWIGSFVSVGMSDETANKIAEGIGYLASGNISGLTSNTQLMNLLVSASNRGNADLSGMLQNGMTAADVDSLMKGLYSQSKAISSSGDMVVKSQYANLFGMSISDIAAMQNLSQEQVDQNITSNMSFSQMGDFTKEELGQAVNRMAMADIITNAVDNVMAMAGESIASNPALYSMWKVADMATQAGGLTIPSLLGLGSGFAQLPDIDQLMKMGLITGSFIGNVGKAIAGIGKAGGLNFDKFNSSSLSSLSSAEQFQVGSMSQDIATLSNSGQTFIGDTSQSSLLSASMAQIKDMVTETGQTNEEASNAEKGASSGDISLLIETIKEEGRKNRGEGLTIQRDTPMSITGWG